MIRSVFFKRTATVLVGLASARYISDAGAPALKPDDLPLIGLASDRAIEMLVDPRVGDDAFVFTVPRQFEGMRWETVTARSLHENVKLRLRLDDHPLFVTSAKHFREAHLHESIPLHDGSWEHWTKRIEAGDTIHIDVLDAPRGARALHVRMAASA